MTQFHFYDETTGLLHGNSIVTNGPDELGTALRHCPPGHKPIEGTLHPLKHKVNVATGEVEDHQPSAPSADYEWNPGPKAWELKPEVAAKQLARAQAQRTIANLETQSLRALRELALGVNGAKDRLQAIDQQIEGLRSDL